MSDNNQPDQNLPPPQVHAENSPSPFPSVDHLLSEQIAENDIAAVRRLWYYIRNCDKITEDVTWPFHDIMIHQPIIFPVTHPDVPVIPPQICEFLMVDIRPLTLEQRLDHASTTMFPREIKKFDSYWINILLDVLRVFTSCRSPRTRSSFSKRKTILENIFGEDEDEQPSETRYNRSRSQAQDVEVESSPSEQERRSGSTIDLNKSIQVMMQIFPQSDRLSGAETEPFMARLSPILEQMSASKIPVEHQPTVLFSLTQTGSRARRVLRTCDLTEADLDQIVELLKENCLYDTNIQDRRATRWKNITYSQFKAKYDTEDEATRECIEYVRVYHKDLPIHLNNDAQLRDRLKEIFKPVSWCSTLFERSIAQYSPSSFASQIITAAANADERKSLNPSSTSANPIFHMEQQHIRNGSSHATQSNYQNLVAFFAKTPPPHRSLRPRNFRDKGNFNRFRFSGRNQGHRFRRSSYPRSLQMRRCYGCNQVGHMIRNCPQKERYMNRLTHYVNVGEAAKMVITSVESDSITADTEELVGFLEESETLDVDEDQEYTEFNTWVCSLLNHLDGAEANNQYNSLLSSSNGTSNMIGQNDTHHAHITEPDQDSFFLNMSIPELQSLSEEITETICHMQQISKFMLIDTGAPKSICSEEWMLKANWQPIEKHQIPNGTKPFRFAGHAVYPKYLACLICKVKDVNGNDHIFRQVVFVLPTLPIPFLTGLQVQRSLGVDLCLRLEKGSHIRIQTWNTTLPLHVTSHLWLEFEPINIDPERKFDWSTLIKATTQDSKQVVNNCFHIDVDGEGRTDGSLACYPVPPWERDEWTSALNKNDIEKMHKILRHPEPTTLLQLFRQQREQRKLPAALKAKISEHKCNDCQENAQLPRVPKISIPPAATPNLAVTLDIMQHDINDRAIKILVMLDAGDMMIRLKKVENESAQAAFSAYFSRWLSIFDAPVFTIVDRGRNLTNKFMAEKLRSVNSQLCPIPTEAPWSIGNNERSHGFLHRILDKLIVGSMLDSVTEIELILGEAEMAWNFVQHTRCTIPHYNRFGVMPRSLGETDSIPNIRDRISLMEIAREHTDKVRAEHTILRALNSKYRHVTELKLFNINDKVWFHRSKHGWRIGIVVKIDRPTIHVQHGNTLYPTHENRIRPYFGDESLPPELQYDDPESYGAMDKPSTPSQNEDNTSNDSMSNPTNNHGIRISDLVHGAFIVDNPIKMATSSIILTDDNMIMMQISSSPCGIVDSMLINHTEVEYIKKLDNLDRNSQAAFNDAKKEEISFLQKNSVEEVDETEVDPTCEIQPLKWVLNIKRSPNSTPSVRHRARLVSASNQTQLRYSVHGNAPTVAMHTIRIVLSLFPTWLTKANEKGEQISLFTRDVTKAFLQSMPSKRLIYYQPPPEFFQMKPFAVRKIWKANIQLYGDVEAGLYWNRTFVPWLCGNISNFSQSIYDPSLLYSSTTDSAMLLCTDDTLSILREKEMKQEEEVTKRFVCTQRNCSPFEFKGIDILQKERTIEISQKAYASKMILEELQLSNCSKTELQRVLTSDEIKLLRSDSGRLAWLATGTSPSSAFQASVSLQGGKDNPRTVSTLLTTRRTLQKINQQDLTTLIYQPLDFETMHIRVYSDGAYQNLTRKHSQIGFIVTISDKTDTSNIIHWHSARASRRPDSTEESEMMALHASIKCIRNMRKIVFQLVKKELPVICYIDNETLWTNLMNITAHSMPEIAYKCREAVYDEILNSVCLIKGTDNPADAMTKEKDNGKLIELVNTNRCHTPPTRTFMLQTSKYKDLNYIPTCKVPMN